MNEMISYISRQTKPTDIADFYTIETPPSSSTSKDSTDEFLLSIQSKKKLKLSTTNIGQKSTNTIICSTSKSTLTTNPVIIKDNEVIEEEKNHIFKI
jgi:hypothetical protein